MKKEYYEEISYWIRLPTVGLIFGVEISVDLTDDFFFFNSSTDRKQLIEENEWDFLKLLVKPYTVIDALDMGI